MLSPIQIFVIKLTVNAVIIHYLEYISFRFSKANLCGENAGVFRSRAGEPAGGVVFAAVIAGCDGFVQAVELVLKLAHIFGADGYVDRRLIEVVGVQVRVFGSFVVFESGVVNKL